VTVTVHKSSATGTFTPTGAAQPLQFSAASARGSAGFYRASARVNGTRAALGWVVLRDGRQRGAMLTAGRILPAPTLALGAATASLGTTTVSAVRISPGSVSSTSFGGGFSGGGFGG